MALCVSREITGRVDDTFRTSRTRQGSELISSRAKRQKNSEGPAPTGPDWGTNEGSAFSCEPAGSQGGVQRCLHRSGNTEIADFGTNLGGQADGGYERMAAVHFARAFASFHSINIPIEITLQGGGCASKSASQSNASCKCNHCRFERGFETSTDLLGNSSSEELLNVYCNILNEVQAELEAGTAGPPPSTASLIQLEQSHALIDLYTALWGTECGVKAGRRSSWEDVDERGPDVENITVMLAEAKCRLFQWFLEHAQRVDASRVVAQILGTLHYFGDEVVFGESCESSDKGGIRLVIQDAQRHLARLLLLGQFEGFIHVASQIALCGDPFAEALVETLLSGQKEFRTAFRLRDSLIYPELHLSTLRFLREQFRAAKLRTTRMFAGKADGGLQANALKGESQLFSLCVELLTGGEAGVDQVISEVFPNCWLSSFIVGLFWRPLESATVVRKFAHILKRSGGRETGDVISFLFAGWQEAHSVMLSKINKGVGRSEHDSALLSILASDFDGVVEYLISHPSMLASPHLADLISMNHRINMEGRSLVKLFLDYAEHFKCVIKVPALADVYLSRSILESRGELQVPVVSAERHLRRRRGRYEGPDVEDADEKGGESPLSVEADSEKSGSARRTAGDERCSDQATAGKAPLAAYPKGGRGIVIDRLLSDLKATGCSYILYQRLESYLDEIADWNNAAESALVKEEKMSALKRLVETSWNTSSEYVERLQAACRLVRVCGLEEHAGEADFDNSVARLSRDVVINLLKSAPESILLIAFSKETQSLLAEAFDGAQFREIELVFQWAENFSILETLRRDTLSICRNTSEGAPLSENLVDAVGWLFQSIALVLELDLPWEVVRSMLEWCLSSLQAAPLLVSASMLSAFNSFWVSFCTRGQFLQFIIKDEMWRSPKGAKVQAVNRAIAALCLNAR